MDIISLAVLIAVVIAGGIGSVAIAKGEFRLYHQQTVTGTPARVFGGICIAVAIGLVAFLAWFGGFAGARW